MFPCSSCFSARTNPDFQALVPTRAAVIWTKPWHTHQIHEWRRLGKILIFNIFPADPCPLSSKKSQDMSCLFQTWVSLELLSGTEMFPGVFILWDYMATPLAGGCRFLEECKCLANKKWGCLWNSLYGLPNLFSSSRRKKK